MTARNGARRALLSAQGVKRLESYQMSFTAGGHFAPRALRA
jgi:hypothetical protein